MTKIWLTLSSLFLNASRQGNSSGFHSMMYLRLSWLSCSIPSLPWRFAAGCWQSGSQVGLGNSVLFKNSDLQPSLGLRKSLSLSRLTLGERRVHPGLLASQSQAEKTFTLLANFEFECCMLLEYGSKPEYPEHPENPDRTDSCPEPLDYEVDMLNMISLCFSWIDN